MDEYTAEIGDGDGNATAYAVLVERMTDDDEDDYAAHLRKTNKPLMEKKRRARINKCLEQLKSLVLDALKKDSVRYSKLEKADILEMTVKHLRHIQRHRMAAIAFDPNVVAKYGSGFHECAHEVDRYLATIDGLRPQVRMRLMQHLRTRFSNLCTKSAFPASQQPARVPCFAAPPVTSGVLSLPGCRAEATRAHALRDNSNRMDYVAQPGSKHPDNKLNVRSLDDNNNCETNRNVCKSRFHLALSVKQETSAEGTMENEKQSPPDTVTHNHAADFLHVDIFKEEPVWRPW